jgi:NAD(P)-dependent dehydrogenase (short-subunit alcohol dehydrogenase family)
MRLKNKVALITGGNSGIGFATARIFLAEGAKVAITGRNTEKLDQAAKDLGAALGAPVLPLQADATDLASLDKAVAATVAKFGKIDVVFANAGIGGFTPLGQTTLEGFEQILRTNLTGVFFTVQSAAPQMNDGGSIIFNGSVISVLGIPNYSAYAATKAGVRAMARVLAAELAPRGIRVNVVAPGGTKTPIWKGAAPTDDAMAVLDARISKAVPLGRMGEADEIAKAALYLASDDASYVNAAELFVDGAATGAPAGAPVYR